MENWFKLILAIIGTVELAAGLVLAFKSRAYSLVKEERDELSRKCDKLKDEQKELKAKYEECMKRPDMTTFGAQLERIATTQVQMSRRLDGQFEVLKRLAGD